MTNLSLNRSKRKREPNNTLSLDEVLKFDLIISENRPNINDVREGNTLYCELHSNIRDIELYLYYNKKLDYIENFRVLSMNDIEKLYKTIQYNIFSKSIDLYNNKSHNIIIKFVKDFNLDIPGEPYTLYIEPMYNAFVTHYWNHKLNEWSTFTYDESVDIRVLDLLFGDEK